MSVRLPKLVTLLRDPAERPAALLLKLVREGLTNLDGGDDMDQDGQPVQVVHSGLTSPALDALLSAASGRGARGVKGYEYPLEEVLGICRRVVDQAPLRFFYSSTVSTTDSDPLSPEDFRQATAAYTLALGTMQGLLKVL